MQKQIFKVIAENIDTIVGIYKTAKGKNIQEIEERIRNAILALKNNKKATSRF